MRQVKELANYVLRSLILTAAVACSQPAYAIDLPIFSAYPRLNTKIWYVSDGWTNGSQHSCEWRKEALSVNEGNLVLAVSDKGKKHRPYSCGEIHTQSLTGYGTYSARLKAAKGSGLNTSFFTYIGPPTGSPHHDEIDFEIVGKNTKNLQVNYYVDGKPMIKKPDVPLDFDLSEDFHDYTIIWQPDKIQWLLDGKLLRETEPGAILPTHPGRIYLTLWSASPAVIDWLGPFEYKGEDYKAEFSWVKFEPAKPEVPAK